MPEDRPLVAVIMGSKSDWATMRHADELLTAFGVPHESREVGQALGRNPIAIIVPCHRVLGADGKMGGFSASGGVATKRRILQIEGAAALSAGPLFEQR